MNIIPDRMEIQATVCTGDKGILFATILQKRSEHSNNLRSIYSVYVRYGKEGD